MDYKQVKEKNVRFFTQLLAEGEDEYHAVGQSRRSQRKRFEKVLEVGDFAGKQILDVGCGVGGFYDFLIEKEIQCDYTGIDIAPKMIAAARARHRGMEERFLVFDILEKNMELTFDYVVSVGPLNLIFDSGINVDTTLRLLKTMYGLAREGAAFSMTSSYTKKPNDETFYYDPAAILAGAAKFCTNLKLDHTYLPHDFTIFCYKKDLYAF